MSVTFQLPSKSLAPRDYQFIALVVILLLVISSALVFANLTLNGGGDFYVHWFAGRVFIFDKIDPYGLDVPARVQQLVYEGSTKAGDEPYILDTPFHILLLYFPFSLLSDPTLARAIFTLFLELGLFALAILSLRLTDWETPRLFTILFIFFAVFNFYTFQAIYESNPVLLPALFYAGILFCLRNEKDELAGALIAVSTYYWEVGAPFLFLIVLRVFYEKRTRVLLGFLMLTIILLAVSFLIYPDWVIPFLRAFLANLRTDFGFNLHLIFNHIWPSEGRVFAWIFIAVMIIILGYETSTMQSGDFRRFYWVCCLSIAIAPLLGFRTEMEHLAVLIIPLALIFSIVHDRWRRIGNALTVLLMLIVCAFPWAIYLFAQVRYGKIAQEINFLFLPLLTVLSLYWIRWWALRPPRTWSDLVNRKS